jgi:uncharacterized membrane protein YjjB (DUF3815 family)
MVLVWTFAATLGFCLLFQCRGWSLLWAAVGGTLGWAVYLALAGLGAGEGPAYAVAAASVTLWSEALSRWSGSPAVSFLLPGLIPLVPGKAIFTAMDLAVRKQLAEAAAAGWETLVIAAAIVVGVAAVSVVLRKTRH